MLEQGRIVALLFLTNATPRHWPEADVELIREVAERVRTAIARLEAESGGALLAVWLNELIYRCETEHVLFARFAVRQVVGRFGGRSIGTTDGGF